MPLCRTGHLQTYYQDIGKHPQTILLLHGWGHRWDTWSALIPTLSAHYRLILVDLPGFGQTSSPHTGWDMHQYSVWLQTFLHELNITELHAVIGHSFGAKLASFAWLKYQDHLTLPPVTTGIFSISPSGIVAPESWTKKMLQNALAFIPTAVKRKVFGGLRTFVYQKMLHETDYLMATHFQEETLHKILAQDLRTASSHISATALHLAWGDKDTAVPIWMAYPFASQSSHSDVFVIPGGGHFIHHTHVPSISTWLESWL